MKKLIRGVLLYIMPLIAVFMVICAMFPATMFPTTNPDPQALKWFAGLVVFVALYLQYVIRKYV